MWTTPERLNDSYENIKGWLLLAYYEEGLHCLRKKMSQVPIIYNLLQKAFGIYVQFNFTLAIR